MSGLLPSEISRLVLGHLRQSNCPETAARYVQENESLREVAFAESRGRAPRLTVDGKSLENFIDEDYR